VLPELERQIAQQENFISVLLGHNPGPIGGEGTSTRFSSPRCPRRCQHHCSNAGPEQRLVAANADIGVAKAAYFPDISLTGLLGLESAQLSSLFRGPSRVWSFGAGVVQPIFNAGRISSQVAQAEALERQALYTYEKSIISAFQDVENALIDRTKFEQVRDEQVKNVAPLRRFRDLAELRYKEVATIYLEVATADQSLFVAQLALVATQPTSR
jgi:multidrug efflux system outer membrane protein